jgi:hypothetical protein
MEDLDMALVATEVGFEAIGDLLDYYINMLGLAVASIANATNEDSEKVFRALEDSLGLTGKLEYYINVLKASTEVNKFVVEE